MSRQKLDAIVGSLADTVRVMGEAVTDLMERGNRLRRLEATSAELAFSGAEFEQRARLLETRRVFTLGCVVLVSSVICFLILVFTSYVTQH